MINRKPQSTSSRSAAGAASAALKRLDIRTASRWVTLLTAAISVAVALPGAQVHDLWLAGGAACIVALVTLPALREPRLAITVLLGGNLLLAIGLSGDYQQRTAYTLLQYLAAANAGALLPKAPAFVSSALLGVGFAGAKAMVLRTNGFPYGIEAIATDITGFFMLTTLSYLLAASQRQIEHLHGQLVEKTQQTQNELQLTLELSRDMVVVLDPQGKILSISPACEAILGYSPEELVGRYTAELIHPDDRRRSARVRQDLIASGGLMRFESRYLHKNGTEEWLEWHAGRFEGESIIRCVARNITERKRADVERVRLVAILEATTDFVSIVAPDGAGLYLNQAGRDITGIRQLESWGLDRLYPARSLAVMERQAIPSAMRDGAWSGEIKWLDHDGGEVPVSQVILAHKGPDGSVEYLSAIARDISERQRHQAELTFLETHDSLTGLLNRQGFSEALSAGLFRTPGGRGAVLHIDLDEFKDINDSLGHTAGDELLRHVCAVLRQHLRPSQVLARLGGDEFGVFLPGTESAEAQRTAGALLAALRQQPYPLGDRLINVTASIGIALYPAHGPTYEDLLAHADQAMFQAKEKGRNVLTVFVPDSGWSARLQSRFSWEQVIRHALEADGLVLFAQPILNIATNQISHYELLLRMGGPDGNLVPPMAFLPVAERYGLIHQIDRWVVRQAIRLLHRHEAEGRSLSLEVNLSGKALTDPELLQVIRRELDASHVDPSRLVLEITETAAIADFDMAREFVGTLKQLGCRFALDDFGAGFSSFDRLKRISVDYLKLDGSFIRNLPADAEDQHLVQAMVDVARGLGKVTIAEFVENAETLDLLQCLGVDYAQGYYVGHPRPVSEIWPESEMTEATAP